MKEACVVMHLISALVVLGLSIGMMTTYTSTQWQIWLVMFMVQCVGAGCGISAKQK